MISLIAAILFYLSSYYLDLSSAVLVWKYDREHFLKNEMNLDIKWILQNGMNVKGLLQHSLNGFIIVILVAFSISIFSGRNLFSEVFLAVGSLNLFGFLTNWISLTWAILKNDKSK